MSFIYTFLFSTNFPSTETFSSDFEYFTGINVLLRRKRFSALFTEKAQQSGDDVVVVVVVGGSSEYTIYLCVTSQQV